MSNLYKSMQGMTCAMVTRPYANENPIVRVEGEEAARLATAERIAAMLNGAADPEIVRLRQIIVDTNNVLFDGHQAEADDIEHAIECHADTLPSIARKLAKINREAMHLVSPVVLDLVGG